MPINPMTLDKLEPITIKNIEHKIIDRLVHEIKGAEIAKEDKNRGNSFNQKQQEKAAEKFVYFLSKFNIKLEYKIYKNRVKVRIKDKNGKVILENEVDNIEELLKNVSRDTGKIIDLKG
ncbi:MAG: hypothetical protein K0R09_1518 [Clostridiales bacterium]|nr:hypothetical protein [Clostridiales bacterium]